MDMTKVMISALARAESEGENPESEFASERGEHRGRIQNPKFASSLAPKPRTLRESRIQNQNPESRIRIRRERGRRIRIQSYGTALAGVVWKMGESDSRIRIRSPRGQKRGRRGGESESKVQTASTEILTGRWTVFKVQNLRGQNQRGRSDNSGRIIIAKLYMIFKFSITRRNKQAEAPDPGLRRQ